MFAFLVARLLQLLMLMLLLLCCNGDRYRSNSVVVGKLGWGVVRFGWPVLAFWDVRVL